MILGNSIAWNFLTTDQNIVNLLSNASHNPTDFFDSLGDRIKDGPHRTVWRLIGPWGDIHVKKNPLHNFRAWSRRLLRPSKGEMERLNAAKLKKHGIKSVEILVVGEEKKWNGAGWVVSRTITNGVPLDQALFNASPKTLRTISVLLASFLARMHRASAFHPDLHPGNILLDENKTFYVLDIHNIGWSKSNIYNRINNLVLLNRWFQIRSAFWERTRFFKEYFIHWQEHLGECPGNYRNFIRLIEEKTHQSNQVLWKNRDKRCLLENREFSSSIKNGYKIHALNPPINQVIEHLTCDSEKLQFSQIIKQSKSSVIGMTMLQGPSDNLNVIVKILPHRSMLIDWIRSLWELPGRKAWRIGHAMRARGLPTPCPLGYSLNMTFFGGEERLIVEYIPGSVQLDDWWKKNRCDIKKFNEMAINLGFLIRRMHVQGVRHRDLKAANILIDGNNKPWIIDLAGTFLFKIVPEQIKLKDLARLARSAVAGGLGLTACLRFFKAYGGGELKPDWKFKWRVISQIVNVSLLRQAINGRPLG